MKRWIAVWICMAALLVMGGTVFASQEEETQEESVVACEAESIVNPLYGGITKRSVAQTYAGDGSSGIPQTSGPRLESLSEGALYLRNAFKSRQTHVEFGFYCDEPLQAPLDQLESETFIHTGVPTEGDYLKYQYYQIDTTCYLIASGSRYCYLLFMDIVYMTDASQEAAVDQAVSSLLGELGLSGLSSSEKAFRIYDWICSHVSYDYAHMNDMSYLRQFSAYAALVDRTAVCQGYAVLLYRLLLSSGVDARVIAGTGNGALHAWNIIGIDGLYYNADATWDAEGAEYDYFLRCADHFPGHVRQSEYLTAAFVSAYPMASQDYEYEEETETQPAEPADGLVLDSDGVCRYYRMGELAADYTGLCEYGGCWFYVKNGVLDWTYTGLCAYNGCWFYIGGGVLDWNYTGLCEYGGCWFYVENGVLDWNYTGLCAYNGSWFYICNGVIDWNYSGYVVYQGKQCHVTGGIMD